MKLKIFVDDSGQLGVNYTRRPARRTDDQMKLLSQATKGAKSNEKKRRWQSWMRGGEGNSESESDSNAEGKQNKLFDPQLFASGPELWASAAHR